MVVVGGLDLVLGSRLGSLAVQEVKTLGLKQLVDLSTSETSKQLLGELVGDGLALATLLVLKNLHLLNSVLALCAVDRGWCSWCTYGLERSGAGNEFVGELGFVVLFAVNFSVLVESKHFYVCSCVCRRKVVDNK